MRKENVCQSFSRHKGSQFRYISSGNGIRLALVTSGSEANARQKLRDAARALRAHRPDHTFERMGDIVDTQYRVPQGT